MLDAKVIELKSKVTGLDPVTGKKVLATAAGLRAAINAQIPSGPVDDKGKHFDTIISGSVKEFIFGLNEQIVIDVDLAYSVAKKYWSVRYNTIYPNDNLIVLGTTSDIFDRLSGVTFLFSEEEYKEMVDNSSLLAELVLRLG